MDWKKWVGRKVFIILNNGSKYTAVIQEVDQHNESNVQISLLDKFNNLILIKSKDIELMREEREKPETE